MSDRFEELDEGPEDRANDEQPADVAVAEPEWIDPCPHIDTFTLLADLDAARAALRVQQREASMMEAYLAVQDLDDVPGPQVGGNTLRVGDRRRSKPRPGRVSNRGTSRDAPGSGVPLTDDQKTRIAAFALQTLKERVQLECEAFNAEILQLEAAIAEADIRLHETAKAEYDFNRDVCNAPVHMRTGKPSAELLFSHVQHRIKTKETQLDKMQQREGTLRRHQSAATRKAHQQAEIGSLLHPIDLQQLEIENAQHLAKIDEKSRELLALKVRVAEATKVLNASKNTIAEKDAEFRRISEEIASREKLLAKVEREAETVGAERDSALEINRKLNAQLNEYIVPSVLDYVANKVNLKQARAAVTTWQRKVEVAEQDCIRLKQRWDSAYKQSTMANSTKIAQSLAAAAWKGPAATSPATVSLAGRRF